MNTGDIYQVHQDPFTGLKREKPTYVFIVSPNAPNRLGMALVCPISATGVEHHTEFGVTLGSAGTKVQGTILCRHLQAVDLTASAATFCEKAPGSIISEVLARVPPML